MEQNISDILNSYHLLRNVLQSAFQITTELFTPPYADIKKIDQGLRALIWTNYSEESSKLSFDNPSQKYRLLVIKSNLGFYNVLALLGLGKQPDFISVGPFRDEELSPNYFFQIIRDCHISPSDMQSLKHIYEQMPYAQPDAVTAVTKQILEAYLPEFKDVAAELIQYSEQKRAVNINTNLLEEYSVEHAEQYQKSLFFFLETIKSGDTPRAQEALQAFLQEARFVYDNNLREYKWMLQSLNYYCHMNLLTTNIHPFYVMKQMVSTRTKIETISSMAKLEQMPNEICHKYCLLVKNYANPDYSKLTKDVIDYIQLHMEEELSLSHLAEHFHRNPSSLSHTFRKETGIRLTSFIHQTRIQEAIHLLQTTDRSVSDIAITVGYQDFSYFSKVFSQITGQSPRAYKTQGLSKKS